MNDHTPQCQLVTKPFTECDCGMPSEEAEPIPEVPRAVIQTFSGLGASTLFPDPAHVRFDDIASSLSCKTRFNGHVGFYPVAQHCVLGASLLPSPFKLAFLLHEVSEVLLPDVPGPTKPFVTVDVPGSGLVSWSDLEDIHARAYLEGLGLMSIYPLLHCPEVKAMDNAMLLAEAEQLHRGPLIPEWAKVPGEPASVEIDRWAPEKAENAFRTMFRELTNRWGDL